MGHVPRVSEKRLKNANANAAQTLATEIASWAGRRGTKSQSRVESWKSEARKCWGKSIKIKFQLKLH